MKKIILFLLSLCLLLSGCGTVSEGTDAAVTTVSTEPPQTINTLPTSSTETSAETIPIEQVLEELEGILSKNFANVDIEYNENMITVRLWQTGVAEAASIATAGNESYLISWNSFVESQKELCLTIYNNNVDIGLTGISVTVNWLNDLDTEKVLLSIVNGEVIYNAVAE